MGEAKRREKLGPTRRIRVSNNELTDLVNYLVGPPEEAGPKLDKEARRILRSALDQIGVLEMWRRARKGTLTEAELRKLPETQVRELTVDAINTLLSRLTLMDTRTALNLGDFEERLEDAKNGDHDPDEGAPAGEAAALSAVPTEADNSSSLTGREIVKT